MDEVWVQSHPQVSVLSVPITSWHFVRFQSDVEPTESVWRDDLPVRVWWVQRFKYRPIWLESWPKKCVFLDVLEQSESHFGSFLASNPSKIPANGRYLKRVCVAANVVLYRHHKHHFPAGRHLVKIEELVRHTSYHFLFFFGGGRGIETKFRVILDCLGTEIKFTSDPERFRLQNLVSANSDAGRHRLDRLIQTSFGTQSMRRHKVIHSTTIKGARIFVWDIR